MKFDGWTLAVHGGAGLVRLASLTASQEAAARDGLRAALAAGSSVLEAGGEALDAVTAAVAVLEDHPSFNAGRGSVLAADGSVRMDASCMRGVDRAAGAVSDVRRVRHPVLLARAVMERSPWVMVTSAAAEELARELGIERVDEQWLITEERRALLETARALGRVALDHELPPDAPRGTVGAVARDAGGGLAAATSTGGLANKLPGRVGDSAVIGAGTWAEHGVCAVSATGHGEAFIRANVASRVAAAMLWGGRTAADAAALALSEVVALGGNGGLIVADAKGSLETPFRTAGMYRGTARAGEIHVVDIW